MKRPNFIITLILFLCFINRYALFAQGGPPLPVSPSAAAVAKAVNYPVNLNTGLPDISVPLGKIEAGGNLVLPVQISYHAGGFKVNEQSGPLGMGWSMNTDLQITRSVNGIDDFGVAGYITNNDIYPYDNTSNGSFVYNRVKYYQMANGDRDGMPDKFNYKLLNKSGSFYFQKNASGYTIVPIPYDNIRIEFASNRFIITDTDGTKYFFGNTSSGWSSDDIDVLGYEVTNETTITAWRCISIIDHTGNNYMNFSYSKKAEEVSYSPSDKIEYYNNSNPCSVSDFSGEGFYQPATAYNPASSNLFTNLLAQAQKFYRLASPKMIEYYNGVARYFIQFVKNQTTGLVEKQLYNYTEEGGNVTRVKGLALQSISFRGGSLTIGGTTVLSGVEFKNQSGTIERRVDFYQSYKSRMYSSQDVRTYYLDSLSISGSNSTYSREWVRFLYRNKVDFGPYLKGHDSWGYRNATTVDADYAKVTGLPGLTPFNTVVQNYSLPASGGCPTPQPSTSFELGNPAVNEYPDETYMAYGMLKRIIYSSGGFADFDFEPNQYHHTTGGFKPLLYAGGLRIQKITFYDGVSPVNKPSGQKYYVYGDLETGDGIAAGKPDLEFGYSTFRYGTLKYTQNIVYADAISTWWPSNVIENGLTYFEIPCTNWNCLTVKTVETKTTYMPSSARDITYTGGSPIYYAKVTEYQQDYGVETGKTVTEFYPYGQFSGENLPAIPQGIISGTDIRYLGVDWHTGALKSVAHYQSAAGNYVLQSKKEYEYTKYKLPVMPRVVYSFPRNIWHISSSMSDFYINANFDAGLNSSAMANLGEDCIAGQYGIPVGKLLLSGETETVRDKFTGTLLVSSSQFFYDKLPYVQPSRIVKTDSKLQQVTQYMSYPYDFPGNVACSTMTAENMIQPLVEERVTVGSAEISKSVTEYGVVASQSFIKPLTVKKSIQGNTNLETEISFTKYDAFGNIQEYIGKDGIVQSFIYGYLSKYPVASLKGVEYQALPAGILNSAVLSSPASDQEMRDLLAPLYTSFGNASFINIYTHRPLVGVTSMTDQSGRKTFYEYDGAGRLSIVKDDAGNILKKNELLHGEPGPYAYDLFYVNKPMKGTYNNAFCNTYFVDEPTMAGQYPRHYVMPGGSNVWGGMGGQPVEIEIDGVTNNATTCNTTGDFATIRLSTFLFVTIPQVVYIDFVKEGHVFATYKFMYSPGNTEIRDIHLPAGSYQVSLRPSSNYKGNLLKYRFYNPSNQTNYWLETGSTMNLVNNVSYDLEAINISGANYPLLP